MHQDLVDGFSEITEAVLVNCMMVRKEHVNLSRGNHAIFIIHGLLSIK